ncbi:MAG: hypothetical protein ACP5QP_01735 [Brevinematia bacterium]
MSKKISEFELSAREKIECMEYFSKGLLPGKNFIHGGFFWPGESNLRDGLSVILYKVMKNFQDKDNLKDIRAEFEKLINSTEYKIESKACFTKDAVFWYKPRNLFKNNINARFSRFKKDEFVKIVAGRVSTAGEIKRRSGFVFLKIIHPQEVSENKLCKEKIWKLRKTLVNLWKDLTENKEIKAYLENVLRLSDIFERDLAEESLTDSSIFKLFGYLAPFDFTTFEFTTFLSRARLFEKEKKPEELLQEIEQDKNHEGLWEDLKFALEENELNLEWLKELLYKIYNKEFLEKLRRDWKEVVKKLLSGERSDKIIGAFVQKDHEVEGRLSYGTFSIPDKEVDISVFYEEGLEKKVEDFIKGLQKAAATFKKFTGNIGLKIVEKSNIKELIPDFEKLKKINYSKKGELGVRDSIDILFNLVFFIARLKIFIEQSRKKNKPHAIILLLDTDIREENGSYPFWNYFSFAYDFFSIPAQTLNKYTIQRFIDYGKNRIQERDVQGIYKNLFISLMKDLKSLEFEFEGFKVPENLTIYALLEKPSTGFCYERGQYSPGSKVLRHYLYEAYTIQIEGNKIRTEIEDKFVVLAGGIDFDRNRLTRWIEDRINKSTKFCFITASKQGEFYIKDIINRSSQADQIKEKSLFVEYSELPITYISERAEKDCFVMYTNEFEKLRKELSIDIQKQKIGIALKPADPQSNRFLLSDGERFYHSILQVFSTEGPGWEEDEIYKEKKSLFLLTVLALSQYESESFQTPYAKLELWQKKKNLYIKLRRDNGEYTLGLSGILYELLYLASKVPVDDFSRF